MAKEITLPKTVISKFNRSVQRDATGALKVMTKKRYENIEDQKMVEVPVSDFDRIMTLVNNIVVESGKFQAQI